MKGHSLGRRLLGKVATIVTPDTILRWHHKLIAMMGTFAKKRTCRPGIMKEIRELIVRMASENSSWGYTRIQGELKKLNHTVARSTIANTLKAHGIPPSTERKTTWRSFLKTHADAICATDFFTTEVWAERGPVTHYVLFVIHHSTRAIHFAGVTTNPDSAFMAQVARNLTDRIDGFLRGKRYLILDNDSLFSAELKRILRDRADKLQFWPLRQHASSSETQPRPRYRGPISDAMRSGLGEYPAGEFRSGLLAPGRYVFQVAGEGLPWQTIGVIVRPGETTELDIVAREGVQRRIRTMPSRQGWFRRLGYVEKFHGEVVGAYTNWHRSDEPVEAVELLLPGRYESSITDEAGKAVHNRYTVSEDRQSDAALVHRLRRNNSVASRSEPHMPIA